MEIAWGIHQVDGVNGNCYILVRTGLTVIDTGLSGSGKKILAYIRDRLHRNPEEIQTVILTHFHLDHTGGLTALKTAAPSLKVAIGEEDAGYVDGSLPVPVHPGFRGLLLRIAGIFMTPPPFRPDILLKDGDGIAGLRCVHLPGHTPGSIGLYDETTGSFFTGDLLRYDGTTLTEGPAFATMDLDASRASIRKLASRDFDQLLPGHGVPLHSGAALKVREYAAGLPESG